ncbi:MAG: hypothetical protein GY694_10985 [Gammaproteobacteria bacterium]|nr:hypothetical protein [Gammaproteobacteria bacterium]
MQKKTLWIDMITNVARATLMTSASFVFIVSAFFTTSCSSNVEEFNSSKSLGAQLDELHQAYQSQAITEKEYKKAKEILIDHYQ